MGTLIIQVLLPFFEGMGGLLSESRGPRRFPFNSLTKQEIHFFPFNTLLLGTIFPYIFDSLGFQHPIEHHIEHPTQHMSPEYEEKKEYVSQITLQVKETRIYFGLWSLQVSLTISD
jgi:hypothetical protein